MSSSSSEFEKILRQLHTNDPALTSLNLYRNSIGAQAATALATALEVNSTLTTLFLSSNSIGDSGATALATALQENSSLTTLYLGDNSIGTPGASALATALRQNSYLTILSLSMESIGADGITVLAKTVRQNTLNAIGAEGARALATALHYNSSLTSLEVMENSIGDSGARYFAAALENNSSLKELDLRSNSIGDSGSSALASALQHNSSLTILDLYNNSIRDDGASAFGTSLQVNSSLTTLNLSRNVIRAPGASALATALHRNSILTTLGLSFNAIQHSGATDLAVALKVNSSLTALYLSRNAIGDAGFRSIIESGNSSLQTVILKNNNITTIPLSFAEFHSVTRLELDENPLVAPPLDFVKGATAAQIKEYLRASRSAVTRLKLLVVGYEETGKSCLVEALSQASPFSSLIELKAHIGENLSTHGIKILAWKASTKPVLYFNIFDFAGQPVYYSTHRNFLAQEQAVYVVVFRSDHPVHTTEKQLKQWLNLIGSQIDLHQRERFVNGESKKPAVVVIGTHADLCGSNEQDDHQALYRALYRTNAYASVLELHPQVLFINHDIPSSVNALRNLIVDMGRKQLEMTPLGLDIFANLFPRLDNIRKPDISQPLFLSIDKFRSIMLECNPTQLDSIDRIGVEGLARSLQTMGEVVFLEKLNRVCVEPQRLLNMLAEFVQKQKEFRCQYKSHVEHETGMVSYEAIEGVYNRHNLSIAMASDDTVMPVDSMVAAFELLDLCVEVRQQEFFFPSLLPEAGEKSHLTKYFRNPKRRFDVQWQICRTQSRGNVPSSSSSSVVHHEEETETTTETAPESLMFGIHLDIVRQMGREFDELRFWSNGLHLKRYNAMEVAVESSAGSGRDAVMRLSIRDPGIETEDYPEFIRLFDALVELIKMRLKRSVFHELSVVGVCPHCLGLVEGITHNRPVTTRSSVVELTHHESSQELQPYFVYPLRRILGYFDIAPPMQFCSSSLRNLSSEPFSNTVFVSFLFLDPPNPPISSSPSLSPSPSDPPLLPITPDKETFVHSQEESMTIVSTRSAFPPPNTFDARSQIELAAIEFNQHAIAPRSGTTVEDPALWSFSAGIRASRNTIEYLQRQFRIIEFQLMSTFQDSLKEVRLDACPFEIKPAFVQAGSVANGTYLISPDLDMILVINSTQPLFLRKDGEKLSYYRTPDNLDVSVNPAMVKIFSNACSFAINQFLIGQRQTPELKSTEFKTNGMIMYAFQEKAAENSPGIRLNFKLVPVMKATNTIYLLLDGENGELVQSSTQLATCTIETYSEYFPGLREMMVVLKLVHEAGIIQGVSILEKVPSRALEVAVLLTVRKRGAAAAEWWRTNSFTTLFRAAIAEILNSIESNSPLPSLNDPNADLLCEIRAAPEEFVVYYDRWKQIEASELLNELEARLDQLRNFPSSSHQPTSSSSEPNFSPPSSPDQSFDQQQSLVRPFKRLKHPTRQDHPSKK